MNRNKSANDKVIITLNGKPFDVPPGGSLGILALGNVGIKAWKQAKLKWEQEQNNAKEEK
jgi:hypothetical protein